MNIFLLLSASFLVVNHAKGDCGCNKVNRRDTIEDIATEDEGTCNLTKNEEVDDLALIPGGEFFIGTNKPVFIADRESPERKATVNSFYLDKYEVSNANWYQFVQSTGYQSDAERFGDSFVFEGVLTDEVKQENKGFRVVGAEWWYKIRGANWQHPEGINSTIEGRENHPVVHISWRDANRYCKWRNKRLPTEIEFEAACRGGRKGKLFPWGDKLMPYGEHWMNIWQGDFPTHNTESDGYYTTCPVNKFRQNNYDLYNIVGNVWEWTADLWDESDSHSESNEPKKRVKKGGSYLCHESYCFRYRCAARSQNTEDSSAANLGFRCAKSKDD